MALACFTSTRKDLSALPDAINCSRSASPTSALRSLHSWPPVSVLAKVYASYLSGFFFLDYVIRVVCTLQCWLLCFLNSACVGWGDLLVKTQKLALVMSVVSQIAVCSCLGRLRL